MRAKLSLLPLLLLASCATPENRIRTALVNAGVDRPVAGCMAERMVDRLSMAQLRRLSSLSKIGERELRSLTVRELLHRVRALGDPEILSVVASAGIGCAIAA